MRVLLSYCTCYLQPTRIQIHVVCLLGFLSRRNVTYKNMNISLKCSLLTRSDPGPRLIIRTVGYITRSSVKAVRPFRPQHPLYTYKHPHYVLFQKYQRIRIRRKVWNFEWIYPIKHVFTCYNVSTSKTPT